MSTDQATELQALWERLRASGMVDPLVAAEQLAVLLLMKMGQPRRWSDLLGADEAFGLLQQNFPLWQRDIEPPTFRLARRDVSLQLPTRAHLEEAMAIVDRVGSSQAEVIAFFDLVLDLLVYGGRQASLRTPSELADLMVALVHLGPVEVVVDPACGAGGLLWRAASSMASQSARGTSLNTLHGYDIDPRLVRLAATSLAVRGFHHVHLEPRNSLGGDLLWPACDVVLTNPPFAPVHDAELDPALGLAGSRSELAFIERARELLRPGGRCAIVVPQSVLFATSANHRDVRRRLVRNTSIEVIVSLQDVRFGSGDRLSVAVIVFHNTGEPSREILFHTPKGPLHTVPGCIAEARHELAAGTHREYVDRYGGATWHASFADVAEANYELIPQRYRPAATIDPPGRPEALIAELRAGRAQFDEGLAAIEDLLGL
jgi:N-6 DNA Methylase